MSVGMAILFLLSTLTCFTLLVAGLHYYFRTRNDPLANRLLELQERSMGGEARPHLTGDFWDFLLQSTYGLVFGKSWFSQKELELMRAGFRGPQAVKVFGVLSLVFTVGLAITAYAAMRDGDASMLVLGLSGALVVGISFPSKFCSRCGIAIE